MKRQRYTVKRARFCGAAWWEVWDRATGRKVGGAGAGDYRTRAQAARAAEQYEQVVAWYAARGRTITITR